MNREPMTMTTNIQERSKEEWTRRYVCFIPILFIIAFGTSLSIRANLGSSPISAPPFILSLVPGVTLTMGTLTIIMHVVFIIAQKVLLGKDFERRQYSQILVSLLFGAYTDLTMWLTSFMQVPFSIDPAIGYPLRFVELLIGGGLLAFGIALEVRCDSLMLAGEGLPLAISRRTGKDFGKVKMCSDTSLVVIGAVLMLVFFGRWDWKMIGAGTLVSMFYVGCMVRVFTPRVTWLDRLLLPAATYEAARIEAATAAATPHLIVTIAREYGSEGKTIGEALAKQLGVPCYSRHLIDETAKRLGYTSEFVAKSEQNIPTRKLWELIFTDKQIPPSMNPSKDDAIFVSQSRTIRELAQNGSCVIVGRLANWILRDYPHIIRVFVTADFNMAVKRVMDKENVNYNDAAQRVRLNNDGRANHYWQYTGGQWTDPHNYDIVINGDTVGVNGAVDIIKRIITVRQAS